MSSQIPSTPVPAWNAYGPSIAGERNDTFRRNPSATTYAIQANEMSSAKTAPIHHNMCVTLLLYRQLPSLCSRASS